jgi:hypothetical protein
LGLTGHAFLLVVLRNVELELVKILWLQLVQTFVEFQKLAKRNFSFD